jgi:hypothetical protein
MSIFDFLKKSKSHSGLNPSEDKSVDVVTSNGDGTTEIARTTPEIPENVFIEYVKPKQKNMEDVESKSDVSNLQTLYRYLENNLESKGYDDALMNPDSSLLEEHIQFIQNDLNLLISKVKNYYSGYVRTIDFHIETRKKNGMIETVEELLTHKDTVLDEIKLVLSIEEDTNKGRGLSQNLILGYKKGFRNGFAAITYNTVLGKTK